MAAAPPSARSGPARSGPARSGQQATDIGEVLCRELGREKIILPQSNQLADYGRDESGLGQFPPDCAVLCESAEQVQAVLRIASERKIAVTPRGAGSGMTGGALPVRGGIVLSTAGAELKRAMLPGFLLILTAGLAAAYATCRPGLLAALPGVAIAAALVPPVASAGLLASLGEFSQASGALLLFFINIS